MMSKSKSVVLDVHRSSFCFCERNCNVGVAYRMCSFKGISDLLQPNAEKCRQYSRWVKLFRSDEDVMCSYSVFTAVTPLLSLLSINDAAGWPSPEMLHPQSHLAEFTEMVIFSC